MWWSCHSPLGRVETETTASVVWCLLLTALTSPYRTSVPGEVLAPQLWNQDSGKPNALSQGRSVFSLTWRYPCQSLLESLLPHPLHLEQENHLSRTLGELKTALLGLSEAVLVPCYTYHSSEDVIVPVPYPIPRCLFHQARFKVFKRRLLGSLWQLSLGHPSQPASGTAG